MAKGTSSGGGGGGTRSIGSMTGSTLRSMDAMIRRADQAMSAAESANNPDAAIRAFLNGGQAVSRANQIISRLEQPRNTPAEQRTVTRALDRVSTTTYSRVTSLAERARRIAGGPVRWGRVGDIENTIRLNVPQRG